MDFTGLSPAQRAVINDNYDLTTEACATCRFWNAETVKGSDRGPDAAGFGFGVCRRRPPVVLDTLAQMSATPPRPGNAVDMDEVFSSVSLYDSTVFPGTYYSTWCGEFEWLPSLMKGGH
jgi:hypothetical protein